MGTQFANLDLSQNALLKSLDKDQRDWVTRSAHTWNDGAAVPVQTERSAPPNKVSLALFLLFILGSSASKCYNMVNKL